MTAYLEAHVADVSLLFPADRILEVGLWTSPASRVKTLWRDRTVTVLDMARVLRRQAAPATHFIVLAGRTDGAEGTDPLMLLVSDLIGLQALDAANFQPVIDRDAWPSPLVLDACINGASQAIALRLDLDALEELGPEAIEA